MPLVSNIQIHQKIQTILHNKPNMKNKKHFTKKNYKKPLTQQYKKKQFLREY